MTSTEKNKPYIRLGICIECKTEPAQKGKQRCWRCNQNLAASQRDRYYAAKEKGICVSCHKEKAVKGSIKCQSCKDKAKQQRIKKETERKLANKCIRCGKKTDGEHIFCKMCLIKNAERIKLERLEGKRAA